MFYRQLEVQVGEKLGLSIDIWDLLENRWWCKLFFFKMWDMYICIRDEFR